MSNIGFRIFTKINRPDAALVEGLRGLPTANIGDCLNRSSMLDARIRKISKGNLIGPAFTVKSRAGDNLLLHKALDMAQPGDVIVFDAHGDLTNAITGELMMQTAVQKKLGGVIIDGAIRDLATLREMDLPIFAAGVTPAGPYKDGPGEINVPVSIGSTVVHPGDILVGDDDGIVVVRQADAAEIAEKARNKQTSEDDKMKSIIGGTLNTSWIDKELAAKGCEIIEDTYR
ncbi:RraA family protein (plasmid) [Rhizobium sp. Pop5]|uniref:RraA family protein n=1 Tax=Rhizobium sp. Pop5 TaxID=1223565 RepID=UPI000283AA60|nr:RraA family protein [Rhizobium sp. Pop5]EJZ18558.1 dimethylmenaquinone methyltransferase [Rhizobium sp. Pop5]UVD60429.1 RraA family protein [Rhizobium sp. Pop5]